jgi:hypothetical protein
MELPFFFSLQSLAKATPTMLKLRFILIFSILAILVIAQDLVTNETAHRPYTFRFKSAHCQNIDKSIVFVSKCFIKAYSRSVSAFTIGYVISEPLVRPIFIQVVLHYRYGTIYREIINSHKRDLCEFLDDHRSNPILYMVLKPAFSSIPNFPKRCPITESADFANITIDNENMAKDQFRFPEGLYLHVIKFFKPEEKLLVDVRFVLEAKSPEKKSFG